MKKLNKKTKILVFNFGGLGDEILFFPVVKALKGLYPNSRITLVTEPRSKAAIDLNENIDKVIVCDIKGKNKYIEMFKLLTKVWGRGYKIALASGSSQMVSILLFLTGSRKRYGYNTGLLSRILLSKTAKLEKNKYAADMYFDLVKAIDNELHPEIPEIDVRSEDIVWAKNAIGVDHEKSLVVVHPGVSKLSVNKKMIKFWKNENWSDLIRKLLDSDKYKVILTGGPDDYEVISYIRESLGKDILNSEDIIDLYGSTKNIGQLAAVIRLSDLLVCVDSAPMHVGVGVRTAVVSIFGPTDENKLLPLYDSRFVAVRNPSAECRPCLWDKRQTSCDEIKCLRVSIDDVYNAIANQLS
ncbi:MAG: glycosyltransferase family 9 protein [bacterium]